MTCRHCELTEKLRAYAQQRVDHVLRHFDGVHNVAMVLSADGPETKVELVIGTVRGQRLAATASAGDATGAVDLVADKMDRQIKKLKEKLRDARS